MAISAAVRQAEEDQRLIRRVRNLATVLIDPAHPPKIHPATRNALKELLRQAEMHEGVK